MVAPIGVCPRIQYEVLQSPDIGCRITDISICSESPAIQTVRADKDDVGPVVESRVRGQSLFQIRHFPPGGVKLLAREEKRNCQHHDYRSVNPRLVAEENQ